MEIVILLKCQVIQDNLKNKFCCYTQFSIFLRNLSNYIHIYKIRGHKNVEYILGKLALFLYLLFILFSFFK